MLEPAIHWQGSSTDVSIVGSMEKDRVQGILNFPHAHVPRYLEPVVDKPCTVSGSMKVGGPGALVTQPVGPIGQRASAVELLPSQSTLLIEATGRALGKKV